MFSNKSKGQWRIYIDKIWIRPPAVEDPGFPKRGHQPLSLEQSLIITARKRSLRRLCFYTCLSVILFGGEWYPSMPCRSPGPHPGGKLRGLAWGVSRPTPGVELRGLAWGGLQAHPGGCVSRPTPEGPQAHTRGVSRPTPGGCIPACTKADTPQTATAVGGTHPTGMNSCSVRFLPNGLVSHLVLTSPCGRPGSTPKVSI